MMMMIGYREDGTTVKFEAWYQNGKIHHDGDLPAEKSYRKGGALSHELWYRNGVKHRDEDLPAEIWYDERGVMCRAGCWRYGYMTAL